VKLCSFDSVVVLPISCSFVASPFFACFGRGGIFVEFGLERVVWGVGCGFFLI